MAEDIVGKCLAPVKAAPLCWVTEKAKAPLAISSSCAQQAVKESAADAKTGFKVLVMVAHMCCFEALQDTGLRRAVMQVVVCAIVRYVAQKHASTD